MKKPLCALALLATAACREPVATPSEPPERAWPTGSRIGTVCFEHEVDGGWEPVQVMSVDGGIPLKHSAVAGAWYFPMDAGQIRLRGCL